ncbi:MAG: hypothetical protein H6953_05135 [Chromatiaceae bacterium]|nr:hypothetical protein [Chromatiaceae bacterium]MCP5314768.1 hypothetical protein [Chromatiaceae bacterium]
MAWITRKKVCRTCGGTDMTRYPRSFWMRLFKGSQLMRCRQCRSTILLLRTVDSGDQGPADGA